MPHACGADLSRRRDLLAAGAGAGGGTHDNWLEGDPLPEHGPLQATQEGGVAGAA